MVKTFKARLENLREILRFIHSQAALNGFDPDTINKIELASEEVVVNIIEYGYPNQEGELSVDCQFSGNGLKIEIKDHGIPFNPLESPPSIDFNASLEDRKIGGCGIFFITTLMDEVNYNRENEMNVLTLVKYKI